MVGLSAFVSPDSFVIRPKVYACNFHPLIKFLYREQSCCRDKVNGAAVRRAVVMVFASLSASFYTGSISRPFTGTSSSGPFYRDSQLIATYRDYAKTHANPDTDGT
jgi:hypothetical protein